MGRSKALAEFQCAAVIGWHHCNKSVHETSSLLDITRLTVSVNVAKGKLVEISATKHPPSPQTLRASSVAELL